MTSRRVTRQSRTRAAEGAPGNWDDEEPEIRSRIQTEEQINERAAEEQDASSANEVNEQDDEGIRLRNRAGVGLLSPSLMNALASANLEAGESPMVERSVSRRMSNRMAEERGVEEGSTEETSDDEVEIAMHGQEVKTVEDEWAEQRELEQERAAEREEPVMRNREEPESIDCNDLMELPLKDLYERRDDIETRIAPRLTPPEAGKLLKRLEKAYDRFSYERRTALRVEQRLAALEKTNKTVPERRYAGGTLRENRANADGRRYESNHEGETPRLPRETETRQHRQARNNRRNQVNEEEEEEDENYRNTYANVVKARSIRPNTLNVAEAKGCTRKRPDRDTTPGQEPEEAIRPRKRCTRRAATPGARRMLNRSKIARTSSLTDARGYVTPDDVEEGSEDETEFIRAQSEVDKTDVGKARDKAIRRARQVQKQRHERVMQGYNPMRVASPPGRKPGQTRRQARREEYDRLYGPPMHNNYPSSDTDASEEYTTEQEPFEVVEARYAGDEGYGDCDWRTWPLHKMRLAHKKLRRMAPQNKNELREEIRSYQRKVLPEVHNKYVRQLEDNLTRKDQKLAQMERVQHEYRIRLGISKAKELSQATMRMADDNTNDVNFEAQRRTTGNPKSKLTQVNVIGENRNNNACTPVVPPLMLGGTQPAEENVVNTATISNPATTRTVTAGYMGDASKSNLEVPIFTGQNWPTFRNQFERVADHLNWTDAEKAVYLHNAIRGDAANALSSAESKNWGYQKLVAHMEMRHGRNKCYGDVVLELMAEYRKPGQTLAAWNDQVINIVNTGNLSKSQMDSTAFYGFVFGLRGNSSMYNKVLSTVSRQTIDEAFSIALKWEQDHGSRSFMTPAGLNMVAAAEDPEIQEQVRAKPETALATMIMRADGCQVSGADIVEKLAGRIDSIGERFDQRFDDLTSRVNTLERDRTKPADGYSNNRGSRGSFSNNYGSSGNRSGSLGGGTWRRRDQNSNYRQGSGRGGYNTRSSDRNQIRGDNENTRDGFRRDRSPRDQRREEERRENGSRRESTGERPSGKTE